MQVIGLDPGTVTGFALWRVDWWKFERIQSYQLHQVLFALAAAPPALVMFEDARRSIVGKKSKTYGDVKRLQGVGSVKRDCAILQEFLDDTGIPYSMAAPLSGGTKWPADYFERVTGWSKQTNEHARDAAVRVWQLNEPMVVGMIRHWEQMRSRKR